ncbi:hypothetical protein HMPREF1624_01993 [Sporothrix schenckii ATCC 58251]|uniref:Uncharacterized protein n=1 Tax=Sporothrix schenckii (strain ATCC 58251 / de Perez 2211183) TaxID=1391915 RepID=U7Q215_SPOS1|nr:hypothetical protein HMPREF1624_01993 [Sporothrix schenckii ATCC 58251]
MPIPPPSSIPTQPPPAGGAGLSRTRSLRRPQAGLPASAAAAAQPAQAAQTGARGPSPSRLPVKPTAGTTTLLSQKPRPPSATGSLASARVRRPDAAPAPSTSSSSSAMAPRPATKPPSSSRTHLISSGSAGTAAGGAVPRRPASASGRPTSSGGLPSSSSTTATSTQMTRTRSAAGASAASGPLRGHTRNKSASIVSGSSATTATKPATRPPPARQPSRPPSATTLSSATVLRPPSAQSSSTASSGTASRPPTRGAASASSTTVTAPARSTAHRRNASAVATSTTSHAAAAAAATHHRPAFSTHQQHYSPAKNLAPKPRIAAILAPPASPSKKPANVALSAETGRLQTTLLQLHLLHRDAAAVTAEWHASARQALAGERLAALAADHAELVQMAGQRAESANATALYEWGRQDGGSFDLGLTLEEKIQALDAVLSGVWSLSAASHQGPTDASSASASSTSRYVQVVRRFDRWAQHTADLVASRQGIDTHEDLMDEDESSGDEHGDRHNNTRVAVGFLSDEKEPLLDAAWHEECAHLVHKLEGWQQQLEHLGRVDNGNEHGKEAHAQQQQQQQQSSLHRILTNCRSLVDGMLDELHMMQQLERDAAEQELAWIRKLNAAAGASSLGLQEHVRQPARAGAIWRVM